MGKILTGLALLAALAVGGSGCSEKPIDVKGTIVDTRWYMFAGRATHSTAIIESNDGKLYHIETNLSNCDINCDPLYKGDKVEVKLGDKMGDVQYFENGKPVKTFSRELLEYKKE